MHNDSLPKVLRVELMTFDACCKHNVAFRCRVAIDRRGTAGGVGVMTMGVFREGGLQRKSPRLSSLVYLGWFHIRRLLSQMVVSVPHQSTC